LPERQRRVFVLKEMEGFKQEEIAGIMGVPVGTVKSLMFRAVKNMRRALSSYDTGRRRTKCDVGMLNV
jgi:RNA polymerase sigma-70 factor (ECF subfamily)